MTPKHKALSKMKLKEKDTQREKMYKHLDKLSHKNKGLSMSDTKFKTK